MPHSSTHLRTLNLEPVLINAWPENQQRAAIRKAWRDLTLRYHPDKNKDHPNIAEITQKFDAVQKAYQALLHPNPSTSNYQPDINQYFVVQSIDIPERAFNLLLEEEIADAYKALLQQFSNLRTEAQKKRFAEYYASFLNLAQALEKKRETSVNQRANYLWEAVNLTLLQEFKLEWRKFIIRVYGKEYLNDFQYRDALGTGELTPILSYSKLLSPIKLIIVLINTTILALKLPYMHGLKLLLNQPFQNFTLSYPTKGLFSKEFLQITLRVAGFCIGLVMMQQTFPTVFIIAMGLPVIAQMLECIASPISQIVNPLVASTALSPTTIKIGLGIVGIGMTFLLASTAFTTGALALLPYVTWATQMYRYYLQIMFLKTMYMQSPGLGIFFGLQQALLLGYVVSMVGFSLFLPRFSTNDVNFSLFLAELFSTTLFYQVLQWIENSKIHSQQMIEEQPLPSEKTSESLIQATLIGYQQANLSHRFFNTPKHAIAKNCPTTPDFEIDTPLLSAH